MGNLKDRATRAATPTPGTGIALPDTNTLAGRIELIGEGLRTRQQAIGQALSKVLDLDVFMGRVLAEIRKNPDLTKCSMSSLMGAVVSAAQLGLEPGPLGHIYLTPRLNSTKVAGQWEKQWEVTLVIGYRGYITLGRRAGGMSIDADAVYEADEFSHVRGTGESLTFRKAMRGDRGDTLGYWMAATFDGGHATHFMRLDELHAHAAKYSGEWQPGEYKGFAGKNWDAWCRKTVIRQAVWRLPQSNELARAAAVDESATYWRDTGELVTVTPEGVIEAEPEQLPASSEPATGEEYDPTTDPTWKQQ